MWSVCFCLKMNPNRHTESYWLQHATVPIYEEKLEFMYTKKILYTKKNIKFMYYVTIQYCSCFKNKLHIQKRAWYLFKFEINSYFIINYCLKVILTHPLRRVKVWFFYNWIRNLKKRNIVLVHFYGDLMIVNYDQSIL